MQPNHAGPPEAAGFDACETHPITLAAGSRIVLRSDGLGWSNVHASITSQRRWSGSLQPIDHLCFAYCLRRVATIERLVQGEESPTVAKLKPRHFALVPNRLPTTYRLTGEADILMVYLRDDMVERAARRIFGAAARDYVIRPRIGFLDPLLERLALEIATALHRRATGGDAAYVDELATLAAVHLLHRHCDKRAGKDERPPDGDLPLALGGALHRVRDMIDAHIDRDLSLRMLAGEAGLSPQAFGHAFADVFGATPHQYVIERRIERTRQLLIGTDLPISEIALQAGFASQSHLSAAFRRMTGETPGGFRRAADSRGGRLPRPPDPESASTAKTKKAR